MPTYEYTCLKCKHEYEKREGFDAPSIQTCPRCHGTARRVFHPAPIVFKGSGFYVTDNRKAPPEPASEPKSEPAKSNGDSGAKDVEPAAAG